MVVITAAAITGTVAVYTTVQYVQHAQAARQAQNQLAVGLTELLVESLALPMFDFNDAAIIRSVQAIGSIRGVCQVRVLDTHRHVVIFTGSKVPDSEILLRVQRPIVYRSDSQVITVGEVSMAFARKPLDEEILRGTKEMLFVGLLMCISTVLAVLWSFRSVTKPLAEITRALGKLAGGETELRLPTSSREDEFGRMCDALKRFRDAILARNQAEAAIRHNQERFRDFSLSSADWFWEMDDRLRLTYLSDNFNNIFGVRTEELLGHRRLNIGAFSALNPLSLRSAVFQLICQRSPFRNIELRVRNAAGSILWIAVSGMPRFGDDGKFLGYRGVGQDISVRRNAEEIARKLSLAVEQSPSNVIITNAEGHIEYVNEAFTRTSGYSFDEVRGRNPRILRSGQTAPDTFVQMWAALTKGDAWQGELINRRKTGEIYIEHGSITPLRQPDGTVTHYLAIKEDVTEKKKVEGELQLYRLGLEKRVEERTAELADAKEAAEAANRAKGLFLANMSHEIRTPLNAVLGLARIIMRENRGRKSGVTAKQILEAGEHLLGVINDILDFSRIEAGKLLIEARPFRLASCADNAIKLLSTRAQAKGLLLKTEYDECVFRWVEGDRLRIEQILINLLSNAVKFTEKGSVALRVWRDGAWVMFVVRDTGIGLSGEQLTRLFQPFEQADASTTRKYGGSGLGLVISKNLARQMSGDIGVESSLGQGSVFTLRLPLNEVAAVGGAAPDFAPGSRLNGLRVLAVEDVELNRIVLEDILVTEGASVLFAENGQVAFDMLESSPVPGLDLILTDIQMPVMDGYELAHHVHSQFPLLPIIGLSAHTLADDRQRCIAAGMVAHVAKPIDPDELINTICEQVTWLPGQQQHAAKLRQAPATRELIDWAALAERYRGRAQFQERLFAVLVRTHADTAVKLREAFAAGRRDEVRAIAHTLQGVAGNLEAVVVYALATKLVQTHDLNEMEWGALTGRLADSLDELFEMLRLRPGVQV